MKVAVVGANGKIGQHVVKLLQQSTAHNAVAMVRKEQQIDALAKQKINARLLDLTADVGAIHDALVGVDAVIFTAGSGGHTGSDMTLRIDLDGAVKTIEAAEQGGIKRFVIVSALQAHNREFWPSEMAAYYVAKHYADRELIHSGLDYTIVRPGLLTDDASTGKIKLSANLTEGEIPRQDVAKVLVHVLDKPNTIGKAFDMVSGDVDIESAIRNLA